MSAKRAESPFRNSSPQGSNGRQASADVTARPLWPGLSDDDAASLRNALSVLRSRWIEWFPEFGCVLLGLGEEVAVRPRPGELALHLVSLDEWTFHIHR